MKRFGLIGKTLKHSFSKNYFARKFAEEGISDCSYENFELSSIEEFPQLIKDHPGIAGLNVTIPYKETVIPFLDHTDEITKDIGACNCIDIRKDVLYGFNTDAPAFQNSIEKKLLSHHQCALVLGSGGASKAVQYALKKMHIDFLVVSRNKKDSQLGYEDVGRAVMEGHQVIINTTPLGLYPNVDDEPPIPYEFITRQHLLFDLVYNPPKTKFLQWGEKQGAQVMNGYEMLVAQAEESWRIWNAG